MKLFINEFIKDYKKFSTTLYFLIIIVIMAIKSYLSYYSYTHDTKITPPPAENIIFESLKISLWISSIFVLIMFANNITQEFSKGTAKFLYSRPKSRHSILTSKIFLSFFNYIILSAVAFFFDIIFNKYVLLKNYISLKKALYTNMGNEYFDRLLWKQLGIYFLSFSILMIFFIALTLIICILFRNQILSVIIVVVMFLIKDLINLFLSFAANKFEYCKYLFTNVTNIPFYFESEKGRRTVEEITKLNSTSLLLMLLCYTVFFVLISYIIHARRDIVLD